jgi:glyceraldehyde-3-phosphate dehydrogenase/erythrose-4-phosphate dehydrogenase
MKLAFKAALKSDFGRCFLAFEKDRSMPTKIGISGFGRIGRLALRALLARHKEDLDVVAINDMADLPTNAHVFRYDSTYGPYPGTIEIGEAALTIDGRHDNEWGYSCRVGDLAAFMAEREL